MRFWSSAEHLGSKPADGSALLHSATLSNKFQIFPKRRQASSLGHLPLSTQGEQDFWCSRAQNGPLDQGQLSKLEVVAGVGSIMFNHRPLVHQSVSSSPTQPLYILYGYHRKCLGSRRCPKCLDTCHPHERLQMEFWAPSFSQDQPRPLQPFGV